MASHDPERFTFESDTGVEESYGPLVDADSAPASLPAQWRVLRRALTGPTRGARTRAGSWLAVTAFVGPTLLIGIAETLGAIAGANRRASLVGVAGALVLWLVLGSNTVRYGRIAAGRLRFDVRTDTDPLRFALATLADAVSVVGVAAALGPAGHPLVQAFALVAMALGPLGSLLVNALVNGDRANGILTSTHLMLLGGVAYGVLEDGVPHTALFTAFGVLALAFFVSTGLAGALESGLAGWRLRVLAAWLAAPYALVLATVAAGGGRVRGDGRSLLLAALLAVAAAVVAARRRRPGRFRRAADPRPAAPVSRSEAWNQSGWRLILAMLTFVGPGVALLLNPVDVVDRPPGDARVLPFPRYGPTTRTITVPEVDPSGRLVDRTVRLPDQVLTGWGTITVGPQTYPATGGQKVLGGVGVAGGLFLGGYGAIVLYRARRRSEPDPGVPAPRPAGGGPVRPAAPPAAPRSGDPPGR